MKHITIFVTLLISVTLTGCGQPGTPVSGKISFEDGSPVLSCMVFFTDGKQQAEGAIDATGNYTLKFGGKRGIPPSEYKVFVSAMFRPKDLVLPPNSDDAGARPMINAAFSESASTPLSCTVPDGNYDFAVKKSELYEKDE